MSTEISIDEISDEISDDNDKIYLVTKKGGEEGKKNIWGPIIIKNEVGDEKDVIKGLKEEIIDATHTYMARNAPKAAVAMTGALKDPTELGIKDKIFSNLDFTLFCSSEILSIFKDNSLDFVYIDSFLDFEISFFSCSKTSFF